MYAYYNRYKTTNTDEQYKLVPFVKLANKDTDKFYTYEVSRSRLDKISQEYYNSPYFGWLILLVNPEYGGYEWNIPNGTPIRIPFPLDVTINEYKTKLSNLNNLYAS
jgi:hypothetical protein